jgi:hypothetical protein
MAPGETRSWSIRLPRGYAAKMKDCSHRAGFAVGVFVQNAQQMLGTPMPATACDADIAALFRSTLVVPTRGLQDDLSP